MLRDIGHEVMGPINGLNEGLPQYEVPKSWLQLLESQNIMAPTPISTPSQLPTGDRSYQRPIPPRPSELGNTVIDPALLEPMNTNAVASPPIVDPVIIAEGSVGEGSSSAEGSGLADSGPFTAPGRPQTRSTQKRKVVTTDELALLEAKELLKGGTTRRTRTRTRRRG